jgi:hypothetical protein
MGIPLVLCLKGKLERHHFCVDYNVDQDALDGRDCDVSFVPRAEVRVMNG